MGSGQKRSKKLESYCILFLKKFRCVDAAESSFFRDKKNDDGASGNLKLTSATTTAVSKMMQQNPNQMMNAGAGQIDPAMQQQQQMQMQAQNQQNYQQNMGGGAGASYMMDHNQAAAMGVQQRMMRSSMNQ
uniref:Uncharacterized protein n=1 Tax=Romanomermis culicivorax TaxID=13658 RepID=A0A915J1Q2_ROMCU